MSRGGGESTDPDLSEEAWLAQWWHHGVYLSTMEGQEMESEICMTDTEPKSTESLIEDNVGYNGIIDSGASWSIVGEKWIQHWSNLRGEDRWKRCVAASIRKFRFGDIRVFDSMGSVLLNATVTDMAGKRYLWLSKLTFCHVKFRF